MSPVPDQTSPVPDQTPAGSEPPEPAPMPPGLSPRRIGRRLAQLAAVVVVIGVLVLVGPGLGSVRHHLSHASGGWLIGAVLLEVLAALSYVVIFRAVFCPRMRWELSYQIGMAEQAANSVLSVSGTGGLALGAWALNRGGMNIHHIARRTVAFFFLTSIANVWSLIVFAVLFAVGVFHEDRNGITYAFGAAGALATALVMLVVPRLAPREGGATSSASARGKVRAAVRFARNSLGNGVRDALLLLRSHPIPIFVGSFGAMGADLAVLGLAFKAFGYSPPIGVLVVAYLVGQLGGNVPIPGGILGLDAGLIGAFVLYHQPLAVTTAAVLIYHAISLWIPGLLGSVAFVQLRTTLQRESKPAALCLPLAEPIETVTLPASAGRST